MKKNVYNIKDSFECDGKNMLIVRMNGAACVMPEIEYNRIIEAERKYLRLKQRSNKRVA